MEVQIKEMYIKPEVVKQELLRDITAVTSGYIRPPED